MSRKFAMFTDVHFGRRQNNQQHSDDILEFIDWFIVQVKADSSITDIAFLGDYFESRSTISIQTLDYAYVALKKLNALGLPIWFLVGNHDLHRRSTREVYSTAVFQELTNVVIINEPIHTKNLVFAPYLFDHEYEQLPRTADYYFGHFSFRGFLITGYNTLMDKGIEHSMLKHAKRILAGHFHRRQIRDNTAYIGNFSPLDFGDVNDINRGMAVIDVETNDLKFYNWPGCPTFARTTISRILGGEMSFLPKTTIKCVLDANVSYSEAQLLRESMVMEFGLRDFILEDDALARQELLEGATDVISEEYGTIDEEVVAMLDSINDSPIYKPQKLVEIYRGIRT